MLLCWRYSLALILTALQHYVLTRGEVTIRISSPQCDKYLFGYNFKSALIFIQLVINKLTKVIVLYIQIKKF
jgi:hypothetical protein